MPDKETYIIGFECRNCGYRWKEEIPKGVRAVEEWNHGVTLLRDWLDDYVRAIRCPNCGCQRDVRKML